jgi:hypothetical protein
MDNPGSARALALLAIMCVANSGAVAAQAPGARAGPPNRPPTLFVVEFLNATIAPTKFSGAPWDGFGGAKPGAVAVLASLVTAAEPSTAVITAAARLGVKGTELPEPVGYVEAYRDGETEAGPRCVLADMPVERHERDTLTPSFRCQFRLSRDLSAYRFRLKLVDKDVTDHDLIGVAEIGPEALLEALKSERISQVRVADQTNGQLLSVGISVRATAP